MKYFMIIENGFFETEESNLSAHTSKTEELYELGWAVVKGELDPENSDDVYEGVVMRDGKHCAMYEKASSKNMSDFKEITREVKRIKVHDIALQILKKEKTDKSFEEVGQVLTKTQTLRLFEEIALLPGKRNVSMNFNSQGVNMAAEGGFFQYERMDRSINLEGKNTVSLDHFPETKLFVTELGWVDIILKNDNSSILFTFKPERQ